MFIPFHVIVKYKSSTIYPFICFPAVEQREAVGFRSGPPGLVPDVRVAADAPEIPAGILPDQADRHHRERFREGHVRAQGARPGQRAAAVEDTRLRDRTLPELRLRHVLFELVRGPDQTAGEECVSRDDGGLPDAFAVSGRAAHGHRHNWKPLRGETRGKSGVECGRLRCNRKHRGHYREEWAEEGFAERPDARAASGREEHETSEYARFRDEIC